MDRFPHQSRNDSTPERGTTPQGNGREGKGRGMEGNASAILLVVESGQVPNPSYVTKGSRIGLGR